MTSMKMLTLVGVGMACYAYFKKNPIEKTIKKIGRETSRRMYNMFEEDM